MDADTLGLAAAAAVAIANLLAIFVSSESKIGKVLDFVALNFGKNRSDPERQ